MSCYLNLLMQEFYKLIIVVILHFKIIVDIIQEIYINRLDYLR